MKKSLILAGVVTASVLLGTSITASAADDSFAAAGRISGIGNPVYGGEQFWIEGDLKTSDIKGIRLNKSYSSYETRQEKFPCIYKFTIAEKTKIRVTVTVPNGSVEDKEEVYWGITNNIDYVYSRTSDDDEIIDFWSSAEGKGKKYKDAATLTLNPGTYYIGVNTPNKHTVSVTTVKSDSAGEMATSTKYMPSFKMNVGDTYTLVKSSTGEGTVKYNTTNKAVATVSSKGVITAKGKGTCYITAQQGETKYTYKITVDGKASDTGSTTQKPTTTSKTYGAYTDGGLKWYRATVSNAKSEGLSDNAITYAYNKDKSLVIIRNNTNKVISLEYENMKDISLYPYGYAVVATADITAKNGFTLVNSMSTPIITDTFKPIYDIGKVISIDKVTKVDSDTVDITWHTNLPINTYAFIHPIFASYSKDNSAILDSEESLFVTTGKKYTTTLDIINEYWWRDDVVLDENTVFAVYPYTDSYAITKDDYSKAKQTKATEYFKIISEGNNTYTLSAKKQSNEVMTTPIFHCSAKSKSSGKTVYSGLIKGNVLGLNALTVVFPEAVDVTTINLISWGDFEIAESVAQEGKVLNIHCWNDEIWQRLNDSYPNYVNNGDGTGTIGDVTVCFEINPNIDNGYEIPLDAHLFDVTNLHSDEVVDIFLVDDTNIDKYINSSYTLNLADLGFTSDLTDNMYNYTVQLGTDVEGNLKAVSWQAAPGVFAYRRDIAKEVFKTDDETKIEDMMATAEGRLKVAERLNAKGYKLYAGIEDSFRAMTCDRERTLVTDKNTIVVPDSYKAWTDEMKLMYEKGYIGDATLWDRQWSCEQNADGKTFGFYYSTWGINHTLKGNAYGAEDKWGICEAPYDYFWGGSWLCASAYTDNPTLVSDILMTLTTNNDVAYNMATDTSIGEFPNNIEVVNKLASDKNVIDDFYANQNTYTVFNQAGKNVDLKLSFYDEVINESYLNAMIEYIKGNTTYEEALQTFYTNVIIKYPSLKEGGSSFGQ